MAAIPCLCTTRLLVAVARADGEGAVPATGEGGGRSEARVYCWPPQLACMLTPPAPPLPPPSLGVRRVHVVARKHAHIGARHREEAAVSNGLWEGRG